MWYVNFDTKGAIWWRNDLTVAYWSSGGLPGGWTPSLRSEILNCITWRLFTCTHLQTGSERKIYPASCWYLHVSVWPLDDHHQTLSQSNAIHAFPSTLKRSRTNPATLNLRINDMLLVFLKYHTWSWIIWPESEKRKVCSTVPNMQIRNNTLESSSSYFSQWF